ncbi:MAG: hypothetical protein DRR16_11365 [Candidatus Parabeggiatoa sp. nov. 3]|nr:MAG: hypothetical protein DRR16_11365 [Gammaproteobacteria bacterium]
MECLQNKFCTPLSLQVAVNVILLAYVPNLFCWPECKISDYHGFWGGANTQVRPYKILKRGGEHAGSPLQDSQKGGEHVGSPLHFVGANLRVRPFKSAAPKIRYNQQNLFCWFSFQIYFAGFRSKFILLVVALHCHSQLIIRFVLIFELMAGSA